MFVLILVTLLFSVRGSNADTGADWGRQFCDRGYCITLIEGEITAEAGLCVVVPCLFTTEYGFIPQHIVWYKCEPSKQRCGDSDIIFHTNKNNKKVQSGFKGRVSLLEPDVTQGNCSIIVNDLTESDSGSYQLRVNGFLYGREVGYTFYTRARVSVKGLTQRPTVMIPPLTEGQQTTLTCTAPGLCSGSDPEITWMWGGAGETVSCITGNITAFKTEDLTAVTQRHSSTLTFDPSAKHHGTDVTCKVSFTNNITTEETVTLNVTYVKEVKITGNTSVKEGEALSLICSVESFPPALITWTKYSDEMQNKTETILQNNTVTDLRNDTVTDLQNDPVTDLQNDTVTDLQNDTVTDLQNDAVTFLRKSGMGTFSILNVRTADSGLYICTAKHLNNTLMGKVNVTVICLTQRPTVMIPPLTEGQQTTLTCTAPGLCSGSDPEITWMWGGAGEMDSHITGNITAFKTEDLTAVTQRHSSTLTFNPSAKHNGTTVTCKVSFANSISTEETVTLNVSLKGNTATEKMTTPDMTTVTTPASTGNTTVEEGDALNLTCSIKSSHPSALTCTKHGSNKTLQKETTIAPQNNTGTAALVIINVTAEYSGLYICTAQHQTSLTTDSEVNVIFLPTILSSSACVVRLEVLTHVCISEGFPLPTIEWPLLETLTEYSLTTNVSNHTVNIGITVFVKHDNDTTVKCVSNNDARNLIIKTVVLNQEDLLKIFLMAFKMPQVIIAFLIGILLSATICCLARKCDRNKQKNSAETLEMMTIQAVPLINAGHAGENGGAHDQEAAEGGASAPDSNVEPREVEYSAIDFSLLNRTSSRGAEDTQGTTETEYAEIKNKVTEESQDSGGEEGEMLEGNEEKEVTIEEEKETEQCVSAVEEGGEDVAVYSNVNEIMGEM
ncbi:sialic acid-binding Ig-like lectin 5 isoform X1 [Epinephelus moara]|uniref:sialic acid-binding Ig-like lectin 5 isoform X1 n=1 Tax=Epinephelus moara TaxID=300413 RepID=UPI00214E153E|nr:sialic acid-binding Ig-like lectin 5 isoform X1 [Epinephelus moara]